MTPPSAKGFVWLVGAGPGDPGLITVAAIQRLREADVVVYDRLVSPRLLDELRPDAIRVFAGKGPDRHTMTQERINETLVEHGQAGRTVVRLKGGDPFVFGRGGEEAEALRAAGVPFAIVPGVTSAIAAPAYAGIPVTHRAMASSFAVVTGHEDASKEASTIDWGRIAGAADTLVFLMGVRNLPSIAASLVEHGRDAATPVGVVAAGTLPGQRVVTGTLADIVERVAEAGIRPPAVTIVGDVVSLRESLRWFDNRPLFGRRVLVTRSRRQASALTAMLAAEGADAIEMPTIAIRELADVDAVRRAIDALRRGDYGWTVFTSANAVAIFLRHLRNADLDARAFHCRIAAIGPGTADALAMEGLRADLVPDRFVAEGLLDAMDAEALSGERVLLPRAAGARDVLPDGLRQRGAGVDIIELYRAEPPEPDRDVLEALRRGEIDVVTFASSSTAHNLARMLGGDLSALGGTLVASIGPITSRAVEERGGTVAIEAKEHTIRGLVEALRERLSNSPQ